ncbi:hypothetical protein BDW74DRAFT_129711 [Aspergillus multicolor]|uniref:uncharacterized protein n=1 Tax=Aspergillus multicolor TaxID=41759 RepID=UPI003CCDB983
MASSISGAPLLSAVRARTAVISSYSTVGSSQCRQLSLSSQRSREMKGMPQSFAMKQPAQPSMRIRTSEMARSEMPQDIGLLPGTFIKPLWRNLPSIFQEPKVRLQYEWLWLKSWFQNFMGLVVYSKTEGKGLPLRLKERRLVARDIHKQMYSAFAKGEISTIRNICCTGLANNLVKRIENRPRDEQVTWSLDSYIRAPSTWFTGIRVVSDRATQIPEIPNSGVRQVVLRITSRQSTGKVQRRASKNGTPAENAPKQQDCTEYIVIQKLRWMGEEDGWRVWGHATPTTVDDLNSPFFATGMSFAERYEAMKDAAMGMRK